MKSSDKISKNKSVKLSQANQDELQIYVQNLSQKLFSLKHSFYDKKEYELFYKLVTSNENLNVDNGIHYKSLYFMIEKLKKRLYVSTSSVNEFKILKDEIVHFKKIKVRDDKKDEFIDSVSKASKLQNLTDTEVIEISKSEGISLSDAMRKYQQKEILYNGAKFLNLASYYYTPIVSDENSDWIKNIISVPSEVTFIDELSSITDELDNMFDWWKFSKLNEHYDKDVYIPYIENGVEKSFYPDFVFWLQKGDRQVILFIDPKGTQHTSYLHKVNGYQELFEKNDKAIVFNKADIQIEVKLFMYQVTDDDIDDYYKRFWIKKGSLFESIINNF